jgi:hypothetical protein
MGSIHIKEKRHSTGQQISPPSRSSSEELDFREETATRALAETTPAIPPHSQPIPPPAQHSDLVIVEIPMPEKPRLFGQTRRALSPRPAPPTFELLPCKFQDGNLLEYAFTGRAKDILKYMRYLLGKTATVLLTAKGTVQVKGISTKDGERLPDKFAQIRRLKEFGLSDRQIVRFLNSEYLRVNLLVLRLEAFYAAFASFRLKDVHRCISELAAVGLYDMAVAVWDGYRDNEKEFRGDPDRWASYSKWFEATERQLLERLRRIGIDGNAEGKASGFGRLEELFCLILCHRAMPDPLQACRIVYREFCRTPPYGRIGDHQWMVMTELCKLVRTPADAKRFKAELMKMKMPYPRGSVAQKWLGRLDLRARELEEQAAYMEYRQALDRLQAEASPTFEVQSKEVTKRFTREGLEVVGLDCLEVLIEPEPRTSIGHLSPRIIDDLKIVANGLLLAGQLETALGAFRLLWRDACASFVANSGDPKLLEAQRLQQKLLKRAGKSAGHDSIAKRIDEIAQQGIAEFKI